jgi:hypothetical protein
VTVLVIVEKNRWMPRIRALPGPWTMNTMKPEHPPEEKEPSRIVVTLQAPAWLWVAAMVGAVVVNVIWWVVAK